MSLYVFNVKPTSAIVTADTRQSIAKGGQLYRLNDITRKLHIVDDTIVTVGGVAWIGLMAVSRWSSGVDHSIGRLHAIVMDMLPHLDEYAAALRAPAVDYTNPYLLELCALRFEPSLGYNVFYHIATYSGYRLEHFEVDGTVHPEAMMFGGIDYEIVQEYFKEHPGRVKSDYIKAVHAAYEQAAGEKIGGTLLIAEQDKSKVSLKEQMIQDRGPVRSYSLTDGTVCNIVGKGLSIACPDANGGSMLFKADRNGMFLFKSRYYMASDGGGKIGMDPHWGIFGGKDEIFDVTDTGFVKPTFVDDDGGILFDKDGFPVNTDFMLGFNGNHYFRGVVNATSGRFTGEIEAKDLRLPSGETFTSVLNLKGQITGDHIDAKGITINNDAGEPVLYMDSTGIHWTPKYSPFKYQYSTSPNGPWHDEPAANDEYRRESTDGGTTWSAGIKYIAKDGKDGRDGSDGTDADVTRRNIERALAYASSLGSSYMAVDSAGAPIIYGGKIYGSEIYAGGSMASGGLVGTGSTISLTSRGIELRNTDNDTNLEITSSLIPGVGTATTLYGGGSPLLLNARSVMIGQNLGTSNARGLEVSSSGTEFAGPVHFAGEVTGVVARFE